MVPQAIREFYDSRNFEDAVRTAVSLGGDSDTLTCTTGGFAHAFYGDVQKDIQVTAYEILMTGWVRLFCCSWSGIAMRAVGVRITIASQIGD